MSTSRVRHLKLQAAAQPQKQSKVAHPVHVGSFAPQTFRVVGSVLMAFADGTQDIVEYHNARS